ncbi:hypothetical protein [Flavobacterium sp.]|uniref:hypothetical protein n=1 Tax=Flavobacterium sp. TaxID=239 RepID=UPI003527E90F
MPENGLDNNFIVSGNFIREEGGGAYDYYMREFAGVNPATGAALFWMDIDEAILPQVDNLRKTTLKLICIELQRFPPDVRRFEVDEVDLLLVLILPIKWVVMQLMESGCLECR